MASPPASLTTLLTSLAATGVDFLLVGGLAAVAQGAPLTTQDVDVVHRRTSENVDALLTFLASVNARYRGRPGAPLAPSRDALLGPGHNLFMTNLGPLDVLGAIEGGRGYDELRPEAIELEVGGYRVLVLRLAALAELKRGATAAKDRLTSTILEDTLRRQTGVSVVGLYPIEAKEPCHMVEFIIERAAEFDWSQVTQSDPTLPRDAWQVAYDEQPIDENEGRWVCFFHYLNPAVPLLTPRGPVSLPEPTILPPRLASIEHEPPC